MNIKRMSCCCNCLVEYVRGKKSLLEVINILLNRNPGIYGCALLLCHAVLYLHDLVGFASLSQTTAMQLPISSSHSGFVLAIGWLDSMAVGHAVRTCNLVRNEL